MGEEKTNQDTTALLQNLLGLNDMVDKVGGLMRTLVKELIENPDALSKLTVVLQDSFYSAGKRLINDVMGTEDSVEEQVPALATNFLTKMTGVLQDCFYASGKRLLDEFMNDEKREDNIAYLAEWGAAAVSSGGKQILSDGDYLKLVVSIVSDGTLHVLKGILKDTDLKAEVSKLAIGILHDESVKGAAAEAVYKGVHRLCADGDAQKSMALVGNLIVGSQEVKNVLKNTVDSVAIRQREFMVSDEFLGVLKGAGDTAVGTLRSMADVTSKEILADIKKLVFKAEISAAE